MSYEAKGYTESLYKNVHLRKMKCVWSEFLYIYYDKYWLFTDH